MNHRGFKQPSKEDIAMKRAFTLSVRYAQDSARKIEDMISFQAEDVCTEMVGFNNDCYVVQIHGKAYRFLRWLEFVEMDEGRYSACGNFIRFNVSKMEDIKHPKSLSASWEKLYSHSIEKILEEPTQELIKRAKK